jgi:hypothetical protein
MTIAQFMSAGAAVEIAALIREQCRKNTKGTNASGLPDYRNEEQSHHQHLPHKRK